MNCADRYKKCHADCDKYKIYVINNTQKNKKDNMVGYYYERYFSRIKHKK